MKIKYDNWEPRQVSLDVVNETNAIIDDFQSQGYKVTLRQIYYQFVKMGEDAMSRFGFPFDHKNNSHNNIKAYKRFGTIVRNGRMAGLISWEAIEDRAREFHKFWFREDETSLIEDLTKYIRFDRWKRQEVYIEVWVEKEALGNVIERACNPYLVPYMACKGYLSSSEAWRGGRRFMKKLNEGKECVLIHLGDHDPSGIDMTRDNQERLDVFTEVPDGVEVQRIALNMDQVELYQPPPNPSKMKDPRAEQYIEQHGMTSWELDALEPRVIEQLIQDHITPHIDAKIWNEVGQEQEYIEGKLQKLSDNWEKVKNEFL
jgi:hypothetical protein